MNDLVRNALMGAAGGGAETVYLDDVYSTYLYKGTNGANTINNGLDISGEGGLVWVKNRTSARNSMLFDTVRGVNQEIATQSTSTQNNNTGLNQTFTSTGFTFNTTNQDVNSSSANYASWSFRKQKGFFDVVTYTGNGTAGRTVSHSLGCEPGMIWIKNLDSSEDWRVYHRSLGGTHNLVLNESSASAGTTSVFNQTDPTASVFTVGTSDATNKNGDEFIAYVFAGGASTAATARSVEFNGSSGWIHNNNSSSDFTMGTGDFTVECWVKMDDLDQMGFFQISDTAQGLKSSNYQNTIAAAWAGSQYQIYGGNANSFDSSSTPAVAGRWTHVAFVRSSGVSKFYINGKPLISITDTTNYNGTYIAIGGYYSDNYLFDGKISNFRVVKGTAVYTSSFIPTYEPLTNITNTKLLCCNNSSVTGATVTPGTLNPETATASTDSPFDDLAGFKFGEGGDQNLIKCGSYDGNSTANNEIYLGWEPQWWLVKNVTGAQNWQLLDSMRGWVSDGNDQYLVPNNSSADSAFNFGNPTPTGFNLSNASSNWQNASGSTYVYIAIRRPDPLVAKPAEVGTDVFAMDVGNGSSTIPTYDSGFPVDFSLSRTPASAFSWTVAARLIQTKYLYTDTNQGIAGWTHATFDWNAGWGKTGSDATWQSWMWKRGAGFDLVTYKSPGGNNFAVNHNLGKIPEMMWIKRRSSSGYNWTVYHKGLNGGTNSEQYGLHLNSTSAQVDDYGFFADIAPNATTFQVGYDGTTGSSGETYISMLFASFDGISKVGSYNGTGGAVTVTTGFLPRLVIIKRADSGGQWVLLDSLRGLQTTSDSILRLNTSDAQYGSSDNVQTSSTGFTVPTGPGDFNNGDTAGRWIYYAHA